VQLGWLAATDTTLRSPACVHCVTLACMHSGKAVVAPPLLCCRHGVVKMLNLHELGLRTCCLLVVLGPTNPLIQLPTTAQHSTVHHRAVTHLGVRRPVKAEKVVVVEGRGQVVVGTSEAW
jgi:hypothetical protein